MIPRIFHFIYIMNETSRPFNINHYFSILTQCLVNKAEKVKLYTNKVKEMADNPYVQQLYAHFGFKFDLVDCTDVFNWKAVHPDGTCYEIPHMSHKSDIIRLHYLLMEGGVYCDVDTYPVNPMPQEWFDGDKVVWGREIGTFDSMCPNIILAPVGNVFISDVLNMHLKEYDPNYATYESGNWAYYAVVRPYQMLVEDCKSKTFKYSVNLLDGKILQPFGECYEDTEELFWLNRFDKIKDCICIHTWENRNKNILKNFSERYFAECDSTYAIVVRRALMQSHP